MTLPLRRFVFWSHLALGLAAGAVVVVMAGTGVILSFERQWVERAEAAEARAVPPAGGRPLGVEEQVRRALAARPEAVPTSITIAADPGAATVLALGRGGVLYVDPHSGRPTGGGAERLRAFFRGVTEIHRFLGATGDRRRAGRAVTGAANLGFLALVLSGLYLWAPRAVSRRQIRAVAWFRRGLSGRARNFNWHHATGLWLAAPLLVIATSGAAMSYDWVNSLVYRLAGSEPPDALRPVLSGGSGALPQGREDRAPVFDPASVAGLDPMVQTARGRVAGWRTIMIRLPKAQDASISFSIARSHRGRPDLRDSLELDRATGAVVSWLPFSQQSGGRRARSWLRFLHTGEAGGLFGQGVAGVASAGTLLMVWTGFALALRRFFPRRWRDPRSNPLADRSANPSLTN